jgi:hypothetical protein
MEKSSPLGLPYQSNLTMLPVMERGKTSCGTKKCRKFTTLVNEFQTSHVVSTALKGYYCALDHDKSGCSRFVAALLFI